MLTEEQGEPGKEGQKQLIDEFLQSGEILFGMEQYDELINICREFTESFKDDRVYSMLSSAEFAVGDVSSAIKSARKGLALNLNSADNMVNLAFLLQHKGEYSNALQYYMRAKNIGDTDTIAICAENISQLEGIIGKKAAEVIQEKASKYDIGSEFESYRDFLELLDKEDYEKALVYISETVKNLEFERTITCVELWFKLTNTSADILYYNYAVSLNVFGRYDEARAAYERAMLPSVSFAPSASGANDVPNTKFDEYDSDCIGCGSKNTEPVFVSIINKSYGTMNPVRTWKQCKACGLVYIGNMPSGTALGKYYAGHFDYIQSGGGSYAVSELGNLDGYLVYSENRIRRIEELSGGIGRILDIGAGRATFVKVARDHGWQADGLESLPENVEYAKSKWEIELISKDFFDFSPTGTYDVITMFEVIEHLINPWEALDRCASLLNKDGVLVIATPFRDSEFVKERHFMDDFWWSEPSHLSYMDTQTLVDRAGDRGFSCIKIIGSEQGAGRLEVYLRKM